MGSRAKRKNDPGLVPINLSTVFDGRGTVRQFAAVEEPAAADVPGEVVGRADRGVAITRSGNSSAIMPA